MINKIFGSFITGRGSIGLLAVRLIFGSALALHGLQKISNPFGWMGPDASMPGFLQFLAFLSEFGGGLALIFGLLTPLAALGIAITMAVAMATVHAGHPFVGAPGAPSKEGAATYFGIALLMLFSGPGVLSLDALLFGKKRRVKEPVRGSVAAVSMQS